MTFDPKNPPMKPAWAPHDPDQPLQNLHGSGIFHLNGGRGPRPEQLLKDASRHYAEYFNALHPQATSTEHRLEAIKHFEQIAKKHLGARSEYISRADFEKIINDWHWGMAHEAGKLQAEGHFTEAKHWRHQVEFLQEYLKKNP